MTDNKFIDYLRKYEELKMEVEKLKQESLRLLEEGNFMECRIVVEKMFDKQNIIESIDKYEFKWSK